MSLVVWNVVLLRYDRNMKLLFRSRRSHVAVKRQSVIMSADFFTNKSLCSCMHIKFEQLPHTTPHTSSTMRVSYILLVACVFFAVANAARQLGCTYYNGDGCVDSSSAGFVPATATCTTFALNTVTKSWIIDCQNGKMSVKEYDADTCGTGKFYKYVHSILFIGLFTRIICDFVWKRNLIEKYCAKILE